MEANGNWTSEKKIANISKAETAIEQPAKQSLCAGELGKGSPWGLRKNSSASIWAMVP